jgi:hypothetical protein
MRHEIGTIHNSALGMARRHATIVPGYVGSRRVTLGEWAFVLMWSMAILGAFYLWGTERAGLFKDDTEYYGRLAQNLADPGHLPYTFRLLTPWLVSLVPLETAAGFTLVTIVSLLVAAALLYFFMARLGYRSLASLGALTVFLCSSVVVRMLTTPTYVDSVTYALTIAAFLALMAHKHLLFSVLVGVGAINRETALLLLPSYLVAAWPIRGSGRWVRAMLVCCFPVLALVVVILGKLAVMGMLTHGFEGASALAYTGYVQRVPRLGDLLDVYSLFGVAWMALILGWRAAPRWLQVYAVLVIAQLLVSRGDESRNLSHLFPVVIPLVALLLEKAAVRGPRLVAVLVVCMVLSMAHFRWALIPLETVRYALVAFATLLGASLIAWMSWGERRGYRAPGEDIAEAGARSGV